MKVTYSQAVEERAFIKDAVRNRASDIEQIIDDPNASAVWELRADAAPRELVLVVRNGDRQAEEPISFTELSGNGEFTTKLKRIKDALAHNGVWRLAVRQLVDDARVWCQLLPAPTAEEYSVTLNEERSGEYALPALRVASGGSIMWVEPVAGWVVNPTWVEQTRPVGTNKALGRADLKGPGGPIYLYCLEPAGGWVYQAQVLHPDNDSVLFYPLDKPAFLKLAEACLDV